MDKRQQVAVYQPVPPAQPGDQGTWARYAPAPTIVGGNEPLPPKLWLAAFGIFVAGLLLMLIILITLGFALGVSWGTMFFAWSMFAIAALPWGFRTWMDYGSGDKAARDEIKSRERAHARAIHNEDKAHARSTEAWSHQQDLHYAYLMSTVDAEKAIVENQRLQRALEYAHATDGEYRPELMPTDNFVAGRPDPVVPAVSEWVMSLYDNEGRPDAGMFHDNGWMKAGRPWNTVWKGREWATDARRLLEEHVLESEGTGHRLRPEYQDSHSAAVHLAQIRNSR